MRSGVPVNIPALSGNEAKYLVECIETGWVSSVGSYVDKFEKMSAAFAGTKYAVATSSGTTALHICLIMIGVNENDYVITPNITFVATCNSIKYTGADPLFIDTDEKNWQMDLGLLEPGQWVSSGAVTVGVPTAS